MRLTPPILLALLLAGCAADQYHAAANPTLPLRQANMICAQEGFQAYQAQSSPLAGIAAPFGALGGLATGVTTPPPAAMTPRQVGTACMARYGWVRNQ